MKVYWILFFLFVGPVYSKTCSEFLQQKIILLNTCQYSSVNGEECFKQANQYWSLKSLIKATWPLKFAHRLTNDFKDDLDENYKVSFFTEKKVDQLRGKQIKNYLFENHRFLLTTSWQRQEIIIPKK